jgi:hypothetical protein
LIANGTITTTLQTTIVSGIVTYSGKDVKTVMYSRERRNQPAGVQ